MHNDYDRLVIRSPAVLDIEKSVGFLLTKSHQRICAIFKEEFDRYDLTPQQFGLLGFLWQQDNQSQAELSARSQIDRTTMGGLIDRLEKEGLVRRHPHPEDRRAYRICLTPKGQSLADELCPLAERVQAKFVERITPEELATLRTILEKLR
jgi:DNA-binding MarR family transcriptional regulator